MACGPRRSNSEEFTCSDDVASSSIATHNETSKILSSYVTLLLLAACSTNGQPASNLDARDADVAQHDAGAAEPLDGLATDWQVRAAGYLEPRSASWLASPPDIANVKCAMSCHTTFSYLMARSSLAPFAKTPSADAARARFEARVARGGRRHGGPLLRQERRRQGQAVARDGGRPQRGSARARRPRSGKALSASSKSALDRMWSQQRADGTWDWLEFGLEPWETRNDFGAAIAALVAGSVPPARPRRRPPARRSSSATSRSGSTSMVLHDRAMVLYASGKLTTLLEPAQADAIAADLAETQLDDGGFSLGAWGQGDARRARSRRRATATPRPSRCSRSAPACRAERSAPT